MLRLSVDMSKEPPMETTPFQHFYTFNLREWDKAARFAEVVYNTSIRGIAFSYKYPVIAPVEAVNVLEDDRAEEYLNEVVQDVFYSRLNRIMQRTSDEGDRAALFMGRVGASSFLSYLVTEVWGLEEFHTEEDSLTLWRKAVHVAETGEW